ncbi:MAG: ATP-binding cassette domain-containing protein [Acidimicrobiales bacterium]|jgi:branched-chain amino acid transport system ATP-binding protein
MSLIEARAITKHFGGIVALDDVSIALERGEAVALVGPNGAGKTTLFDCLNGVRHYESGEVRFEGRRIDRLPVYERARLGIGRTFQRLELFAGMSAREHLMVAERVHRGDGRLLKDLTGRAKAKAPVARVEELLDELGLLEVADDPIESLSQGHGRLVELGRALVQDPLLVLLDEPSSGLDTRETAEFAAVLTALRDRQATAILLVEHDLDLVRRVVERIYVLDFGKLIASGPVEEALADEEVRRAYLGDLQ